MKQAFNNPFWKMSKFKNQSYSITQQHQDARGSQVAHS